MYDLFVGRAEMRRPCLSLASAHNLTWFITYAYIGRPYNLIDGLHSQKPKVKNPNSHKRKPLIYLSLFSSFA